jgi:hypothetical protein
MQLHHEARTLKLAIEAVWLDPHSQEIKLRCNFGRHKTMLIGPSDAKGDLGFPLDGDLEREPEWLAPREGALGRTTTPIADSQAAPSRCGSVGRTTSTRARWRKGSRRLIGGAGATSRSTASPSTRIRKETQVLVPSESVCRLRSMQDPPLCERGPAPKLRAFRLHGPGAEGRNSAVTCESAGAALVHARCRASQACLHGAPGPRVTASFHFRIHLGRPEH